MQKMDTKICFYSDAREWGGQEMLSAKMANFVRDIFPEVIFFHSSAKFLENLSPKIHSVPLPFFASTPFPIFRDRSHQKQKILRELFKKLQVKVLVICPGNIERCLPAVLVAKKMGIRLISYFPMAFTQRESGAPLGLIRDFLARFIYPKISKWIVISKNQEKLLRRFIGPKKQVWILPNPVSWEAILPPKIPIKPLSIATIGRIYFKQKGQDVIPPLARELSRMGFPCSFRIIGEGPNKKTLEKRIHQYGVGNSVQIHSWMPQSELHEILKNQIHLVFIPSHFEGTPMILFESFACGVPVLVADSEYVKEFELPDWMIYNPQDIQDALQKIRNLPESFREDEFMVCRERLFKNRRLDEFEKRTQEIFLQIFQE
ncbi:glycosyltransferase [uncultured Fibrobacter sp.]|uniref:glycosyltransferase family 4 protein n=1 Tax=uncultured Fibrobacter sp. TaxID=261512 RepID=UPI0025928965|nr:glycosyltransferase [uncultured Fibrobacter sp.]